MKLTRNQLVLNAVFCLALLAVIIWALYFEYDRPWKKYQKEKIQQLYLQDFGETDRCITCHQGTDKTVSSKKPQPFKTHSGDYLKHHKVEKFGCVVCHQGQGAALTVVDAHGDVKNWTKPVLRGLLAQSSCRKCHPMDQRLPLNVELQGAAVFIEGWKLFNEYNCIACHKLKGYERPERIGTILDLVKNKTDRDWLIMWLKNPKDYLEKTKMPRFKLSDEGIDCIADYLLSLSAGYKNPAMSTDFTRGTGSSPGMEKKGDAVKGKKLVKSLGCLGCHVIDKEGSGFASDLSGVGSKIKAEWLLQFLKKPAAVQPKTTMPDPHMSQEETQDTVAYLMTLKKKGGGTKAPSSSQGKLLQENIAKGRKLVKNYGCRGCHEIEKIPAGYDAPPLDGIGSKRVDEVFWGNLTDIKKTRADWLLIKVMNPEKFATDKVVARMPNQGLNEQQAKALVTFLLSLRKDTVPPQYVKILIAPDNPEIKGKKVFEKYNCLGCHKLNKKGGDLSVDLAKEGKKSRPDWLFAFLKTPYKIRPEPILKARMPDFKLSEKEINNVIEYLVFLSEASYPYHFEPKKEVQAEDIDDGEKLYHEIFACIGCHSMNGRGGQVGPDHTDVASRLTKEWIEQWLKDPQAIQPEVRMPRFKFKDWEYEALTDYLLTLGKYRFVQLKKTD
jgi:mono/diheme cytochrome c family protein